MSKGRNERKTEKQQVLLSFLLVKICLSNEFRVPGVWGALEISKGDHSAPKRGLAFFSFLVNKNSLKDLIE